MHGVVSLLPQPFYKMIETLWDEFDSRFGLKSVKITPFPHFSWTVARDYSKPDIQAALGRLSKQINPFTVTTSGIGIFPGSQPVVYIRMVKNPDLFSIHESILAGLREPVLKDLDPNYEPDKWIPHITLAYQDLNKENLGAVISWLANQEFHWKFQIDNLAFISGDSDQTSELKYVYRLQGI
jgi:2'-5' RNA ligase